MEERLSVRIEADIKDFQQGMNQVEANLKNAESVFKNASKSAFQLENAITSLSQQYRSGAISEQEFSNKISVLNADLAKQRGIVANATSEINRLKSVMENARPAPVFVQTTGIVEDLRNKIKQLRTAIVESTNIREIGRLNKDLEQTQIRLNRINSLGLDKTNNRVAQSFNKLSTNVRGSNTVALEFNRIIQDAPFGMMGVGNNIQQLAGNFSNLSKNAGGTVPAIKAAFAAMITGPNLALLAISALTAGITAYNMGAFDFLKSNKEAKKSLEDLKKESEEYVKNLNAIARAQVQGAQGAQAQLTSLKLLYDRTQDVTLSEEERVKAVRELQKVYPQVFGNLNTEIILNGQAKKSYDELATSILATAKARAAEDTLVDNEKQLIALNKERSQVLTEIAEKEKEVAEANARFLQNPGSTVPQYLTADQQVSNTAQEKANQLKEREAELEKQISGLKADNLGLTSEISKEQSNIVTDIEKIPPALKDAVAHAGDLNLKEAFDLSQSFKLDDKEVDKQFADMVKSIQEKITKDEDFVNIPVKVDFTPETVDAETQAQDDAFNESWKNRMKMIEDIGGQMQRTLAGAFEGAISGGENFFDAVVAGFKKMLAQLAAQLAASAVIKVLGMIIGGPAGAALGAGGSGAGSGIGSLVGGLFGGAGMRIGATPAMGVPSTSTSSAGYKVDVNVQGVLRGNDIHVAAQRNNRDFNRYY